MNPVLTRPSAAATWIITLIVLLCLYVVGVGPCVALVRNGVIKDARMKSWVAKISDPVLWTSRKISLVKPLETYIEWWRNILPQKHLRIELR